MSLLQDATGVEKAPCLRRLTRSTITALDSGPSMRSQTGNERPATRADGYTRQEVAKAPTSVGFLEKKYSIAVIRSDVVMVLDNVLFCVELCWILIPLAGSPSPPVVLYTW